MLIGLGRNNQSQLLRLYRRQRVILMQGERNNKKKHMLQIKKL